MIDQAKIIQHLFEVVQQKWSGKTEGIVWPPPSFISMQGEIFDFRLEEGWLQNRFPILHEQLNPYGTMQGGFIAAAIDNTIGPLSMLVSPPNLTRNLEVSYLKAVSPDFHHIFVRAKFLRQQSRELFFEASVENSRGTLLASAKSTHWILSGHS